MTEWASEEEYQNHRPGCAARTGGRLNRERCTCDAPKTASETPLAKTLLWHTQEGHALRAVRGGAECSCGCTFTPTSEESRQALLAVVAAAAGGSPHAPHPPAWTCFHCAETFTDEAEARKHFGNDEMSVTACQIAAADGGLLKALREAEREVGALRNANEQLDHEAGAYHAMSAELERKFGTGVRSAYQAWLKLEAMESRAMAAEEALAAAHQAIPAGHKIGDDMHAREWHCPFCQYGEYKNRDDWKLRAARHLAHCEAIDPVVRADAAPTEPIDNGNTFRFCDVVHGRSGRCVRGAGHNGPHAFVKAPYPMLPVMLGETSA